MTCLPKISVIIPTCDRPAKFLNQAIDSVMLQSLLPCEILVIDNGISPAEFMSLPESVVTLYRLKPRIGVSRARNFGAAMAAGEYLAFLDDDDWWEADFLKEAWCAMTSDRVKCVYGRLDTWRDGKQSQFKVPTVETLNIKTLLRRNPATSGQNLMIAKTLFFSIGGFDERLLTAEDKALALELLLAGEKIGVAPNAVAVLRNHEGGRLSQNVLRRLSFQWKYRRLSSRANFIGRIADIVLNASKNRLKVIFRVMS